MLNNSLKQRIIITLVVILTLTCTIFGAGIFLIKQRLEEATFGHMVRDQLTAVLAQPESEKLLANPLFKGWEFYQGDDANSLPERIKQLPPGSYHSVRLGDKYLHLEVDQQHGKKVYMVYDITEWEDQEHALLTALAWGVLIVVIAGLAIGSQAAKAILVPVRNLTARVANIQPGQRNVRIAGEFEGSEIGPIAHAVDGYLVRLDQFVEREQSFSAAASHELRTPLSVIMGAVDILDTNAETPASVRAVARIKRACADMHAFIEATLFLSREGSTGISQDPQANIGEIVRELVDDNKTRTEQMGIHIDTHINSTLVIPQPRSILQITIGNILRNAIEHSQGKNIAISLQDRSLTIADSGEGIPPEHLPFIFDASYTTKPGGTGLGLNLVKRVCDRFNWQLDVTSVPDEGTTVKITFLSL